jgi:hypothetical protein
MMKTGICALLAAMLLAVASWLPAQAAPNPALLILSKQDRTLAIIDPGNPASRGARAGRQRSARGHCFV